MGHHERRLPGGGRYIRDDDGPVRTEQWLDRHGEVTRLRTTADQGDGTRRIEDHRYDHRVSDDRYHTRVERLQVSERHGTQRPVVLSETRREWEYTNPDRHAPQPRDEAPRRESTTEHGPGGRRTETTIDRPHEHREQVDRREIDASGRVTSETHTLRTTDAAGNETTDTTRSDGTRDVVESNMWGPVRTEHHDGNGRIDVHRYNPGTLDRDPVLREREIIWRDADGEHRAHWLMNLETGRFEPTTDSEIQTPLERGDEPDPQQPREDDRPSSGPPAREDRDDDFSAKRPERDDDFSAKRPDNDDDDDAPGAITQTAVAKTAVRDDDDDQ